MTLYDYIDEYGIKSFEESPINDVDIVLFSFLSYVDYGSIVEREKVLLRDVGRMHFGLHKKGEKNVLAVKDATKLLNYMKDTKRYRNCYLLNYVYEADNTYQFSAISIEYQKNKIFVSYEGTNERISGWKENLVLSYDFPTKTHVKAIRYLNRFYTFSRKELIIGGHSKGGNLALVAAMDCRWLIHRRIRAVYNVDGPGLLEKEFSSLRFQNIKNKYFHIIPDNSIVGILLNNVNDIVIKSNITGPLAHDILFWEVEKNSFVSSKLSTFSKEFQEGIAKYLKTYTPDQLRKSVNDLFQVCEKANISTLLEFKESNRKIIDFLNASKSLEPEARKMVLDLLSIYIKSIGNSKYKDLMEFMKKFKIEGKA